MKIKELQVVAENKYGRIIDRGGHHEPHEYKTVVRLASFGFDIEFLVPSNAPRTKSPDIQMLGTTWEIKSPESDKIHTNSSMFRKAVKQSGGRIIVDLSRIKRNDKSVEKNFVDLFERTRGMRRMILIRKNGSALDFMK